MAKHFNMANIWGRVITIANKKSKIGTKYLAIEVECHGKYGNVKAYGRLWSKKRIDGFKASYKNNPDAIFRFKGFFNQYGKNDIIYSNFTFYDWQIAEEKKYSAAFILTGMITEINETDGEKVISLHIKRAGQKGNGDIEERFELYLLDKKLLPDDSFDREIQCKGMLRTKEPEDEFGFVSGDIKPYIMELKVIEEDKF